ncbi:MAG: ATP-binding protein, partial [Alphaproteobacteria bacterium]|nr:ATP-binding protein [Alphaproteobacteria bacterium]
MATKHLVRTSRDGDRFHYLWAARRCLELLSSKSKLVAVVIEGASPSEDALAPAVEAGEELIDVAEYESSEDFAKASLVRYVQLKHSTLHADSPWTPSGLANTLNGFAQRFANLRTRHGSDRVKAMLRFSFVSNRPIDATLIQTVDEIAHGRPPSFPPMAAKLENILGLAGTDVAEFCALLKLQGSEDGLWEQRNILTQELSGYLPDADVDAPTQLIELVNKKALSESASNPAITKIDVLRALHTDEASLFPAPCLVEVLAAVPREQEVQLVEQIVGARGAPVIIHAAGGVGKSILATRIGEHLPEGSENIVYDCFGNGQYRSASGYRHRHRDALVEIANELAAKQLCHPLIPSVGADGTAYLRVFIHRLKQAVAVLKASHSDALLCIAVDAADNAQMAAEEAGQPRSFI